MDSIFKFLPGEPGGLLHRSALLSDLPTLSRLLDAGEAIDLPDPQSGRTPLMYALIAENREIVADLVHRGANVNANDLNGEAPLIFANAEATTFLANNGARLDASYEYLLVGNSCPLKRSLTPLTWSIVNGETDKVNALIQAGANLDFTPSSQFDPPLILALLYGNLEMVQALLENGADPNVREGEHGTTPAFYAGVDSIELLANFGADLNLVGNLSVYLNQTPLMRAVSSRSIERTKKLIENGADVNYMDEDYFSALSVGVGIDSIPIVQALIDRGADVNPQMPEGSYTPLMSAISSTQYAMIECLMANGAVIKEAEFERALQEDDLDMLEYLQLCADIHNRDALKLFSAPPCETIGTSL